MASCQWWIACLTWSGGFKLHQPLVLVEAKAVKPGPFHFTHWSTTRVATCKNVQSPTRITKGQKNMSHDSTQSSHWEAELQTQTFTGTWRLMLLARWTSCNTFRRGTNSCTFALLKTDSHHSHHNRRFWCFCFISADPDEKNRECIEECIENLNFSPHLPLPLNQLGWPPVASVKVLQMASNLHSPALNLGLQ